MGTSNSKRSSTISEYYNSPEIRKAPSKEAKVSSHIPINMDMELFLCLEVASSSMSACSAFLINGCLIDPALQTLNHTDKDPDVNKWVLNDFNILSKIPFEKLR